MDAVVLFAVAPVLFVVSRTSWIGLVVLGAWLVRQIVTAYVRYVWESTIVWPRWFECCGVIGGTTLVVVGLTSVAVWEAPVLVAAGGVLVFNHARSIWPTKRRGTGETEALVPCL